jgi:hypothetical protein
MTDDADDLRKLIVKKQAAISRLEAKASRCNTATALGLAIATRAETSALYQRKLLEKLVRQLAAHGRGLSQPRPTG